MPHVTDGLWNSIFSKLKQARILVMGTTDRMSAKIHVDHLVDAMSKNCPHLERLEFRFVLNLKVKFFLQVHIFFYKISQLM